MDGRMEPRIGQGLYNRSTTLVFDYTLHYSVIPLILYLRRDVLGRGKVWLRSTLLNKSASVKRRERGKEREESSFEIEIEIEAEVEI